MSKFYITIEQETDVLYQLYTTEVVDNERKNCFGMWFMIAYQLMKRCRGKGDFEIVIEYLKLKDEVKEELEYRIKHSGENSDGAENTRHKLAELDRIPLFFTKID